MTREDLENACRCLAPELDVKLASELGERTGFMLFLFDFAERQPDGKHGHTAYISNAQRQDMISLLDEIKTKLEFGITSDPRGPQAVG